MGEHYAVVRTSDHLEHYGVPGMKWGVRKKYDDIHIPKRLDLAESTHKQKKLSDKLNKMEKDFFANKALVEEHTKKVAKAEARAAMNFGNSFGSYKNAYKQYYNDYKNGVLPSSDIYYSYLNSNPELNKQHNKVLDTMRKEHTKRKTAWEKYANKQVDKIDKFNAK